jgi:hypothetical protein
MTTSSFDKATDKIIANMSPEELAKYVNADSFRLAKLIHDGKLSQEECEQQTKLFMVKHVNRLDVQSYMRYLFALNHESNSFLFRAVGEEHLMRIDAEITICELCIMAHSLENMWWEERYLKSLDADTVGEAIDTKFEGIKAKMKPYFEKIEYLKQQIKEFIEHPNWKHYGGVPEVKEPETILNQVWVEVYEP